MHRTSTVCHSQRVRFRVTVRSTARVSSGEIFIIFSLITNDLPKVICSGETYLYVDDITCVGRNDRRTIQAVNAEEMEISFFQDQKRIVLSGTIYPAR